MRIVPEISDVIDLVKELYNYFSNSTPRHEIFINAQKELDLPVLELERNIETRWFYYLKALQKIELRYEAILVALDVIVESNSGDTSIAIGLNSKITKFQFILLSTVLTVLSKTNALSKHLQFRTQTLQQATSLIKATFTSLESLRNVDTEYENIFAKATEFAERHGVDQDFNTAANASGRQPAEPDRSSEGAKFPEN